MTRRRPEAMVSTRAGRGQATTSERAIEESLRRGLVALTAASLVALSSCGAPCRSIETRPLELSCDEASGFTGELHFDSEATFDTFLRQQCLPDSDDDAVDRLLSSVDFTSEAVFVARGNHRITNTRCLASREVADAQVCATGLKLSFSDEERVVEDCPATRWTVAFVLSRADLRAALDAAP